MPSNNVDLDLIIIPSRAETASIEKSIHSHIEVLCPSAYLNNPIYYFDPDYAKCKDAEHLFHFHWATDFNPENNTDLLVHDGHWKNRKWKKTTFLA